jgi:hypothetical protein
LVSHYAQLKIPFKSKWGSYAYRIIPFGLINDGENFQRDMEISFRGIIGRCVVVYLDDVTIFFRNKKYHVLHLR